MKKPITILALAAILAGTSHAAIIGEKPDFMDKQQLAGMRAEATSNSIKETEDSAFFTGRPYLDCSDEYAFMYRSYNPSIARWNSEDPSGFPDGANGNIYTPTPTTEIDLMGLYAISLAGSTKESIIGTNVTMTVTLPPEQIGNSIAAMTNVTFTAPGITGWIVQQITNDWSKVLNDSDNSPYTPNNPPTQNYWEAWAVTSNGPAFGGVDQWNTIAFPESTYGEFRKTGKVGFYTLQSVQGSSPTSWGIQAPESGLLPSTTTKPTWWNDNGFDRNLTMTWE